MPVIDDWAYATPGARTITIKSSRFNAFLRMNSLHPKGPWSRRRPRRKLPVACTYPAESAWLYAQRINGSTKEISEIVLVAAVDSGHLGTPGRIVGGGAAGGRAAGDGADE